MTFNPTLDFGSLLQVMAFVGSILYSIWKVQASMAILNTKLETLTGRFSKVDQEIEKLGNTLIDIAKLNERMVTMNDRMNNSDVRFQENDKRVLDIANRLSEAQQLLQLLHPPANLPARGRGSKRA